jgi:hypothetical protein
VNPVGGEQFHVGQPVQRAVPEGRVVAHGLGFVEPDRGFRQRIVPRHQLRLIGLVISELFG